MARRRWGNRVNHSKITAKSFSNRVFTLNANVLQCRAPFYEHLIAPQNRSRSVQLVQFPSTGQRHRFGVRWILISLEAIIEVLAKIWVSNFKSFDLLTFELNVRVKRLIAFDAVRSHRVAQDHTELWWPSSSDRTVFALRCQTCRWISFYRGTRRVLGRFSKLFNENFSLAIWRGRYLSTI